MLEKIKKFQKTFSLLSIFFSIFLLITLSLVVVIFNQNIKNKGYKSKAATNTKALVPKPAIIIDGFEIDPDVQQRGLGLEVFNETKQRVNIIIGNLSSKVKRGEITKARANEMIDIFKSANPGKIYLERFPMDGKGQSDPDLILASLATQLQNVDNYDGIFIDEFSDLATKDGQSENAIEILRRIRQSYPNKLIVPALMEVIGFSNKPNPYFNDQIISYNNFLNAANTYSDLIFYEMYLSEAPEELSFIDRTRSAFDDVAPGILSKVIYGLYMEVNP